MNTATQTLPRASAPGPDSDEPSRAGAADGGQARAEALWRAAAAERAAGRYQDSLALFEEAARHFEEAEDHARRGSFRAAYANLLAFLGEAMRRADYLERAAAEYVAAARDFGTGGAARRPAAADETPHGWEGFSFKQAVHRFEADVITRALADAGGSVSKAAHLLGFRHHNSLASIINHRHRELLGERSPIRPRRRSIITVREPPRAPRFAAAGRRAEEKE